MASSHYSQKRRANGESQGSFRQSRHLLDDSSSDEEQETTVSRVSGRSNASNSCQYAVMLDKLRKSPVEVPKGGSSVNPTSKATTTIQQCPGTPQSNHMRSPGAQSRMNATNFEKTHHLLLLLILFQVLRQSYLLQDFKEVEALL